MAQFICPLPPPVDLFVCMRAVHLNYEFISIALHVEHLHILGIRHNSLVRVVHLYGVHTKQLTRSYVLHSRVLSLYWGRGVAQYEEIHWPNSRNAICIIKTIL